MPTFDFTDPSGKSYSVQGPDGATPEQAFQMLQQHIGTPQVGMGEDAAKSVAAGLGSATIGALGSVGDIRSLLSRGADIAGDKLGFDPSMLKSAAGTVFRGLNDAPTSKDVRATVTDPLVDPDYKPQYLTGSLLKKGAELGPNMLLGGPEGALPRFLTNVAAPAVGSELGESVAGPLGGIAGGLAGAVAGPAAFNRAVRAMRPGAETALEDIRAASRANYQHPDVTNVRINPDATEALATTIEHDLQHGANSGFRVANEPKVFSAVNELRLAQQEGRAATVADIDNVRQVLGNAAKERDAQGQLTRQAVAANRAIDHINDFLPRLNQADLLAGNAAAANARLQTARQDWGAYKRAQNVQTLAANAEINAASANSGANIQNATKQAFKPMLKNNAAKAVGYNDEELAALNRIVRGTWTGSAARAAGNLLGGGGGLGMLVGGAAGYHEGGLPGAIGVGLAGRGLKMVGNRSTLNAVADLDRMLRARSPEAIRVAAQNPQIAQHLPPAAMRRLQALVIADPVLVQQLGQPIPANR